MMFNSTFHTSRLKQAICLPKNKLGAKSTMVLSAGAWLLIAGLLIAGLGMTQANAMLPTPAGQDGLLTNNATAPAGLSNTANAINSRINAFIVSQDAQGAEQLTPVSALTTIQRGDVVEYQVQVNNNANERVSEMMVSVGVPPQLRVVGNIQPMAESASVDGVNFSPLPMQAIIDGQLQDIPVMFYRAIRWNVEGLGVNESTTLTYRAQMP